MTKRGWKNAAGAVLLLAGLACGPWNGWLAAALWAAGLVLLDVVAPERGALTYLLPALAAGIWCALAAAAGVGQPAAFGAMLLLLCAGLGAWAALRRKGPALDGKAAVGLFAILLLACQADLLRSALRPAAEASGTAFTALLWFRALYGALLLPFVGTRAPRSTGVALAAAGGVLLAAHVAATYADAAPGQALYVGKMCLLSAEMFLPALLFAGLRCALSRRRG